MRRHTTKSIVKIAITVLAAGGLPVPGAGAPLEPVARTQDFEGAPAGRVDRLPPGGRTRGQLAILYASLSGASFEPPACVTGQEMFEDVPASSLFCPWIEELARRSITEGCTATRYCPGSPVTRAQMATFVVRSTEACPRLDPSDEMIRVGGVCIDKYEASIWDAPVGGNLIEPEDYDSFCPYNGQPQGNADCEDFYARSVPGVPPSRFITWFQAQQALANSGKRLPTNAEWQMVVSGTPDTGGADDGATTCNTDNLEPGVALTGSRSACVSRFGAIDMVGNVWEWVADWVPASAGCPGWVTFSDDFMCLSGASTTIPSSGALLRGGTWFFGAGAGPFEVFGTNRPGSSGNIIGFRGAR